jgi:hypothetical protein
MHAENAIRIIHGYLDALTMTVAQLFRELPKTHRKFLAERIWAEAKDLLESVERGNVLIELIGEPGR